MYDINCATVDSLENRDAFWQTARPYSDAAPRGQISTTLVGDLSATELTDVR